MAAARWRAGWPWEVAALGGPGRGENATGGEAGVFFQGCACLCVGKRDWRGTGAGDSVGSGGGLAEEAGSPSVGLLPWEAGGAGITES